MPVSLSSRSTLKGSPMPTDERPLRVGDWVRFCDWSFLHGQTGEVRSLEVDDTVSVALDDFRGTVTSPISRSRLERIDDAER